MLEFQNVFVSCGRTLILNDISVSFPTGKITSIIGPNGCGKTTLVQCLNGISKVTSGSILTEGKDYLALPVKRRAQLLSFLPQVRTIIPAIPVKTLVEHGRFPHLGFSRRKTPEDTRLVEQAMQFVGVYDYRNDYVDTLSGGIRQRVFFAMVLAQDCDIIVLDEPTTYLDLQGQREFLEMLVSLKKQGKTILVVLHDLSQAIRISDRMIVMNDRKIAATGTPEECLQQHVIEDVFHTKWKRFTDEEGEYFFFT
ncbi:MAG: ABC transporter ATP-binding protein [Acetatifactor sp.]